jgi:hypothetical protein
MTRLCRPVASGLFDDRRQRVAASAASPSTALVPDELVIPDDLSGLDREAVQALHDQAVNAFNEIYGDGSVELSDTDYQTLATVTEAVERLRADLATRDEQSAERQAGLADLAGRVNPAEPDAADADPAEPAEGEDPDPAEGDGAATEGDEFASRQLAQRLPIAGLRARVSRNRPVARPGQAAQGMREYVTAAADLPGYANGASMNWSDIGRALDGRLRSFNAAQFQAAHDRGRAMRQQYGVAVVRRPMPADRVIHSNDPAHVDEVIRRATDQSTLPGGSLVAAGGWCAPSEILYDLLELESNDGIVSVPEIGIARGGIQWTTGPDYSDIFTGAGAGFFYSEAQDIAGSYSQGTNQKQTLTASGTVSGGTFTITLPASDAFLFPATTVPIPFGATAAQVAAALGAIAPAGTVTATGGPLPGTPVVVTFGGILGSLSLPLLIVNGAALTGSTPLITPTITTAGVVGTTGKPTFLVPCPAFQEKRLDLLGVSISAGLLAQRGYPEVLARTVRGALIVHEHKIAASVIAQMVAGSTAVVMPGTEVGNTSPILSAIEMQVDHYRYAHRMPRTTTYEAIFPFWTHGVIRSDLSHRLGINFFDVTDAMINGWFSARGIAAQFVYNWQDITGTADQFTAWATSIQFLLYAAGTWVKGTSDIITLDTIYDSVNLAQNDFTALFTEEGFLVAKRGFDSRVVTVPLTTAVNYGLANAGGGAPGTAVGQ